ncbi:MAG: tRNA lysidine(34) synthetase TilS [Myxococcota bacterium]
MLDHALREALDAAGVSGTRLLVAVSGGRDSVVLLDALIGEAAARDLELVVAHVDHGLRGAASAGDASFVADLAAASALPFVSRRVAPQGVREGRASRDRPSLEEAARDLRRAALTALADAAGARFVVTAHHLGDQAETVLLRLLRGTGPDGLAAMAPIDESGRWFRPLLGTTPESIEVWARQRGLTWREDATNGDRRFARNRLRHDWLPGLAEAFNPQLLRNLGDLAEAQRRDREWIEVLVAEAAKERIEVDARGVRIAIDGWAALPEALARRLARRAMREAGLGRDVRRVHLERVLEFLRRGRSAGRDLRLELPGGSRLRRLDEAFLLTKAEPPERLGGSGDATVSLRD